jgi:hypothetical protein
VHHRTVSGTPRKSGSELASFGNPLRYNSPDCPVSHRTVSGAHRTVRCDSGATTISRATVDCNALNACLREQRSRACAGGTPDSLQGLSGAPPDSQAGPQVRAPTVGTQWSGDVAGASDTVRWRTGLSGAPVDSSLHQRSSLVVGAINTPTTPTFKYPSFPPSNYLQELAFNTRHTKEIKSSPNSTQSFSD